MFDLNMNNSLKYVDITQITLLILNHTINCIFSFAAWDGKDKSEWFLNSSSKSSQLSNTYTTLLNKKKCQDVT